MYYNVINKQYHTTYLSPYGFYSEPQLCQHYVAFISIQDINILLTIIIEGKMPPEDVDRFVNRQQYLYYSLKQ